MDYDVIIIGGGPGGYVAAIRAAQRGLRTALVERADLGGICLNWGCIPTKALLKSAQVYDDLNHAADYGIALQGSASPDLAAMVSRSRSVAAGMNKGVEYLMRSNGVTVVRGHGRVLPGRKVTVTRQDGIATLQGRHVVLAVGARARELPGLPIDGTHVLGFRQAMTLDSLPARMAIVGAGAIGVEFAWFYATLGTKVTLIEARDRIVPQEDAEVSKELERSFARRGIEVLTAAQVDGVTPGDGSATLRVRVAGAERQIACDVVLSAAGVRANLEDLGLEATSIATDAGKVVVDRWYRCCVDGYYAIGDCIAGPALAHVASAEAITCIDRIAGVDAEAVDYGNIPSCTYTQPEVASVGHTEQSAKDAGYEVRVGKFPFSASGKAKAAGHAEGFVKLVFDARYGVLLGAHMIGDHVTELVAELVTARKLETTAEELARAIHPHPTMSEAVMEAATAAFGAAVHL
jgi:dihydrolipoamide dehydrogenase